MTDLVLTPADALPVARPSRAQCDEIAEKWIREHGASSQHTPARYRRDITVFFEWADTAGYDVFAMLPWHIGEYATWLAEGDHARRYRGSTPLSPQTRSGRIAAMSSLYRFVQQNVTTMFMPNPAGHMKRARVTRESKTSGLDAAELDALRAEARHCGPREYALLQLLAGTGLCLRGGRCRRRGSPPKRAPVLPVRRT